MAANRSIAYLVLYWIGFCHLSYGLTPEIQHCEWIMPCTCSHRKVLCKNSNFSRVPVGIPSDTIFLDLSHNEIQEINTKELTHLTSLQTLILHHNLIASIPSWDSFPPSLTSLSLHHNKISKLSSFNTTKKHNLRSLHLHVNRISHLESGAFTNLTRLKILKLNRNKLKTIPSDAFSTLKSLLTLDLRRNEFQSIHPSAFAGLSELKTLKLSKNRISGMANYALLGLDKLERLYLDGNNMSLLDLSCFFGLRDIQVLYLQKNRISLIKAGLSTDWRNFVLLREINLASNQLFRVDDSIFMHLLGLRNLNLANNNIYHITKNAFRDLQSLESLDLSNNAISWTAEEMSGPFIALRNLIFLRLDNNRINLISEKAFLGLSKLQYLNLSANAIATIEENAFDSIKHLTRLWLNTSHLTCDCKVKWLPGWLKSHPTSIGSVSARCRLPHQLQSKSVFNISLAAFVCDFSNPAPQISRHPESINALIGQNVTLRCDVEIYQKNETSVKLSWKHDHSVINSNRIINRAKTTDENTVIYTSELRLVLLGFHDDGFYQCHAFNKFGESFSNRAKLQVREFPIFTRKPDNVTVLAGETIHLPCAAIGHPKPTLSWRKDKGSSKFAAAEERRIVHQQLQNIFLITHSISKDSGLYTCSATNDAGTITATAYVTVLQIPRIMQSMTSKTVKEDESVVLECIANGNPKPQISWFKNREKLVPNSRVLTHLDGQILVIIKAELDDEGDYVCEVTNKLGTARQTAELTVITGNKEVTSSEEKTSAFRYDKKTFLAIIVIVVVSCVVGTSLVWLVVIYCARRGANRALKTEALNTNTAPKDDVSYIPLKSYSSGTTQTSRDSPRSTATFITSSGSQGSTFPPSNASSEQNCECEKALTSDTISTETSKGSHCSLASTCPSVESEPVRQVIHVQIHNSDSNSCNESPTHRKQDDRQIDEQYERSTCSPV